MIIQEHVPFRLSRIGLMVTVLLAILNVPAWSQKAPDDPNVPGYQREHPERYQRIIDQRLRLQTYQQGVAETMAIEQEWAAAKRTQAALPDAAREVVERYEKTTAEAREQFEKENERQRMQAITRLENLAETYAANGLAREAAAVRAAIERIKTGPADARVTPLPPGGTFETFRGQDNQVINVEVTGSTVGTIWGDGVYTDDSPVAVAAVHAGVLREGESGVVAVTIRPGRDRYAGSVQNGVTSSAYDGFPGSYEVKKSDIALAAPRLAPAPALSSLRGHVGEVLYIELTGSTTGVVWGSDVYTDDSSLAAAAVHAGVLKDGESGIVKITIAPADDAYTGSTRNGVETQNFGEWGGSFRIERVPQGFTPPKVYHGAAPSRLHGYGPARLNGLDIEIEGFRGDKDR